MTDRPRPRAPRLEVVEGDITSLEVDAIANAANNRLSMGAGVAGAIKRAGGEEIEREAVAKGPIDVGEALATGAGRLPAKYVVHGAVMGEDLRTDAALVERTTRRYLELADELGVASQREVGLDAILKRRQALLLQTTGLALRERLVGEVGQCGAPPQG